MVMVNDRESLPWYSGMTVQDVLDSLGYVYVHIAVTVNGELINPDMFKDTVVPDNADIKAIHIHHGG